MRWLKPTLGYTLAFSALPITLAVFFGLPYFEQLLVAITGLQVSPHFTGGEVQRRIEHEGYATEIHRPVFDGLLCERKQGFVQVDWTPADQLPDRIDEEIDYDDDGQVDFRILFAPGEEPVVTALDEHVLGLEGVCQVHDAWVVRVGLSNPQR
jgi:hypothetical protein